MFGDFLIFCALLLYVLKTQDFVLVGYFRGSLGMFGDVLKNQAFVFFCNIIFWVFDWECFEISGCLFC